MADPVSSLLSLTSSQQPLIHILFTLLIIGGGHVLVKGLKVFSRKTWLTRGEEVNKKQVERREQKIKLAGNILDVAVITAGLFYLNTGLTEKLFQSLQSYLPRIVTVLLLGLLGVIVIRILTQMLKNFLQTSGVRNYIRETGLSVNSVELLVGAFKAFMYLLLIQLLITQLNIGSTFINEIINASSWAVAFLAASLLFWGFKDLFQNFAAGIYLKNSRIVRPGEEVKVDDESGEIRDISLFSTTVNTDSGYTVLTPNAEIMDTNLRFKRAQSDLDTMEDISNYFIAEKTGYSAAAGLELVMEVYGFRKGQDEIQEKIESQEAEEEDERLSEEERITETVAELTNHEMNAAFIRKDRISDLPEEFKAWFNDEALIMVKMDKDLGSSEESVGYAVATGIEDEDVLLMDPEQEGVYYISSDRLRDAMEVEGGGYMVVAPEGTNSFWRIKNELIYSEKKHYDRELSKTLESRLRKIVRQGRIIKEVTPEAMREYLERWRSEETSTLLWRPGKGEKNDQASEDN